MNLPNRELYFEHLRALVFPNKWIGSTTDKINWEQLEQVVVATMRSFNDSVDNFDNSFAAWANLGHRATAILYYKNKYMLDRDSTVLGNSTGSNDLVSCDQIATLMCNVGISEHHPAVQALKSCMDSDMKFSAKQQATVQEFREFHNRLF